MVAEVVTHAEIDALAVALGHALAASLVPHAPVCLRCEGDGLDRCDSCNYWKVDCLCPQDRQVCRPCPRCKGSGKELR